MSSDPPHYSVREFTPNVIEPSFGLGRILYVLLEHSFWSREQDVERGVRLHRCSAVPMSAPCSPRLLLHRFSGSVPASRRRPHESSDRALECEGRVRAPRQGSL